MDILVNHYHRCAVVKFNGVLDANHVDDLEATLAPIIDSGMHNIVIDLNDVQLVSSKGLGLLIRMQQKCKSPPRGEIVLSRVPARVQKAMKLVAMDGHFKMYDQVLDAVGSF